MKLRFTAIILLLAFVMGMSNAQTNLTKEQIMAMSIEELSDLSLEDLMAAVETLGVSSVDELFAMIMNKNVSSASKEEEDAFTSPLSSSVLTRSEMRTYGLTTIEEAFRLIPGVIVQEKTNGMYDVQLRGLNNIPDNNLLLYSENANTLLMIDGRVAHNYAMGAINFDMLPISIEDIERIEVVRGASSALYGGNAVQGVINIITEKPNPTSKNVSGSCQMGNSDTYVVDFALRKSFTDKFSVGLTFNTQRRDRSTDKLYVMPQHGLFFADRTAQLPGINQPFSQAQLGAYVQQGALKDASNGGYIEVDDIKNLMQVITSPNPQSGEMDYYLFETNMPERNLNNKYKDPSVSRHTTGINGYVTIVPNSDVRFDLSFGYQNSDVMATQVGDSYMSFENRTSETYYGNMNARLYGLSLNADFMAGENNYAVGVPGFNVKPFTYNVAAEYDFSIGDHFAIRPGVTYQYIKYKDVTPYFDYGKGMGTATQAKSGYQKLGGFFDGEADVSTFAPSVRFNANFGNLRLIAALRSDKTSIPDTWNTSYQFVANYLFNDDNFLRLSYGRANRSMTMVNTSSALTVERTNILWPNVLHFVGNDDFDMTNMDNIELGYRWRPSNKVLIDAEAFVSWSRDYGALMSNTARFKLSPETIMRLADVAKNAVEQSTSSISRDMFPAGPEGDQQFMGAMAGATQAAFGQAMGQLNVHNIFNKEAYIKFDNLPYEVRQMGVSLGIDWIISPKLITKFNLNVQKTIIDNYYAYSQNEALSSQLQIAGAKSGAAVQELMMGFAQSVIASGGDINAGMSLLQTVLNNPHADDYIAQSYGKMNPAQQAETMAALYAAAQAGATSYTDENGVVVNHPLSMYYALKYDVRMDEQMNATLGNSEFVQPPLENGHKHKATPGFYGMAGLIYKPISQVNIAAFANFMSGREYLTSFGVDKLNPRFTVNAKVGYHPNANIEFFLSAHNLLNNKKVEFLYGDKIEGLYTLGMTCAF
ncbi:MAG: TonB-dependent receptor plug domain-containing protein [Bacteroidales bacterium]|nr:TonB-dependent receptor plug domain-containing protein [Bacteroidales bacterium]